jgi:hypothetical protein
MQVRGIGLPRTYLGRTSTYSTSRYLGQLAFPLDCRSSRSLTTSSEGLLTLSRVLDAVGLVAGQPTAVVGDEEIDEVLQLPDAR